MTKITALKLADCKGKIAVTLDNLSSFFIGKNTAKESGLYTGKDISEEQISELKQRDHYFSCLQTAQNHLAYRQRSKVEVENRLKKQGYDHDVISSVVSVLQEKKLLDDESFARDWTENRQSFHPRSRRLIQQELRQKGIETEVSNDITSHLNDEDSAYQAGLKKSKLLRAAEYSEFRKRLARYLQLRGFGFSIIETVVERLWRELQEGEHSSGQ